jgi:hypothetical protein
VNLRTSVNLSFLGFDGAAHQGELGRLLGHPDRLPALREALTPAGKPSDAVRGAR